MRGYEKIWIMGDEFAYNTLQQHYKNLKQDDGTPTTYAYLNFEVRAYLTSQHTMNTRNILSRLRNGLVTALNEHAVLPKVIVMVPDDDIINQVKDDPNTNLSFYYERLMSGLCNLLNKSVDCYKDMIPLKAKRETIPHFLWIAPPQHCYFSEDNKSRREIFSNAVNVAVAAQKNMTMLKLVKFWDMDNSNLFLKDQYRYTSEGLTLYWRGVDAAIRFWNVALSKKIDKVKPKKSVSNEQAPQHNRDNWQKPNFNRKWRTNHDTRRNRFKWYNNDYNRNRRRLSTPP